MRWEDENYVKLYTRDTIYWIALSYDAKSLFLQILRKVDRRGEIALGRCGLGGIAVAIGHPEAWPKLEPAFNELLGGNFVVVRDGSVSVVDFQESQRRKKKKYIRSGIGKRLRFRVMKRDGFRCVYCGTTPDLKSLLVDHVVPVAGGGGNEESNLATACFDCNSGKATSAISPQDLGRH